ncbi:MAG: YceI family protein [Actinomycetota bacterium]|nr:YceI family protein [Actinomycetota bacterium]
MDVEQFPGATFTLTAPIKFGAVPATAQPVTASATGDLTLHGVTRSVTIT